MPKINVTPKEFADFSLIFLLNKILKPDEVVDGYEEFDEFGDTLTKKGMRSILLKYYLGLESNMRVKYKRIKDVFEGDDGSYIININNKEEKDG